MAPRGVPGQLLSRWRAGPFEVIVSDKVLAEGQRAFLVSGDSHLLDLSQTLPVLSPRDFVDRLAAVSRR